MKLIRLIQLASVLAVTTTAAVGADSSADIAVRFRGLFPSEDLDWDSAAGADVQIRFWGEDRLGLALALGIESPEPGGMERPPRPPREPIIHREMWWGIAVQSVLITAITLVAFQVGLNWFEGHIEHAQTLAFATLVMAELLRAFTARSERALLWTLGLRSNTMMLWAVGSSLLVLLATVYVPFLDPIFHTTPLGLKEWALLIPLSFVPAIGAEVRKAVLRRVEARRNPVGTQNPNIPSPQDSEHGDG